VKKDIVKCRLEARKIQFLSLYLPYASVNEKERVSLQDIGHNIHRVFQEE
jgi:hypothetical protein